MTRQKDTILMIHGIISDKKFFDGLKSLLVDDYNVVTYDRRGYGEDYPNKYDDYSVEEQAKDAYNVLRVNNISQAWILGNSAGGLVALELCLQHPEMVKGIVMVETSLVVSEYSETLISGWNAKLNRYKETNRVAYALRDFTEILGGKRKSGVSREIGTLENTFRNLENFMDGELNSIQRYRPSVDRIKKSSTQVTYIITYYGEDRMFGRVAKDAATVMGWPIVRCDGNHNVIKDNPESVVATIRRCFVRYDNG